MLTFLLRISLVNVGKSGIIQGFTKNFTKKHLLKNIFYIMFYLNP